jgi:hypothetical protein
MGKKPTDGYDERLRRALESGPRPLSARGLAGELAAEHPRLNRGKSYGGVRAYIDGRVRNPRMDLLRAIADTLRIRWQWLAYADGPMTEAEGAIAAAEGARRQEEAGAAVLGFLERELPDFPSLPDWSRAVIFEAVRRFTRADLVTLSGEEVASELTPAAVEAAFHVGQTLAAVLNQAQESFGELSDDSKAELLADCARALMNLRKGA